MEHEEWVYTSEAELAPFLKTLAVKLVILDLAGRPAVEKSLK